MSVLAPFYTLGQPWGRHRKIYWQVWLYEWHSDDMGKTTRQAVERCLWKVAGDKGPQFWRVKNWCKYLLIGRWWWALKAEHCSRLHSSTLWARKPSRVCTSELLRHTRRTQELSTGRNLRSGQGMTQEAIRVWRMFFQVMDCSQI